MNHVEMIRRYLKNKKDVDIVSSGFPYVTIGRQAGAGGHTLGREILRELDNVPDAEIRDGWEMFDQKLCAMIAQDKFTPVSFEELVKEEYHSGVRQSFLEMLLGHPEQYELQKKINEVIRLLAQIGKAVIIGRGGVCLTQNISNGIRIRLVAPESLRVKSMADMLEVPEKKALTMIRQQDRDRARMIREFFNRDIDDPLLYDATFNTAQVSLEEMAVAIVRIIVLRWPKKPAKKIHSLDD